MKMTISDVRLSVQPTKNPMYLNIGVRIDEEHRAAAGLSHTGMAFAVVNRDEFIALMAMGFKPFAKATLSGDFREEPNKDPAKNSLLKFDLDDISFQGGTGSWDVFLAESAKGKPESEGDKPEDTAPKSF